MFDTTHSIVEYLQAALGDKLEDYAHQYGEPGYRLDGDRPLVILGNYWCRCSKFDPTDERPLHGIEAHYPHAFARLEELGVQFEWSDEWLVDYETGKAYRTSADSYSWMPSYVHTEDGELLTADDDVETWIDWAIDGYEPRVIPSHIYDGSDVEAAGFTKHNGTFESGWHPGQDADPSSIAAEIHDEHGDETQVVFVLDESSQFYIGFTAYYRVPTDD